MNRANVPSTDGPIYRKDLNAFSGPGRLWLASPLTVAASAFTGRITAYTPGMFAKRPVAV